MSFLDETGLARLWSKIKAKDEAIEDEIDAINTSLANIFNFFYPVGSYYETTDTDFDPNTAWGGTWVLEDEGLVHVSSGTNYIVSSNAKDGGHEYVYYTPSGSNAPVTLTEEQCALPAHTHGSLSNEEKLLSTSASGGGISRRTVASGSSVANVLYSDYAVNRIASTGSTNKSASASHNHTFTGTQSTIDVRQSYKVVNRWHRTA